MHRVLAIGVAVAFGARCVWFGEFLILSLSRVGRGKPLARYATAVRTNAMLPAALRGSREIAQERAATFLSARNSLHTIGGLGLAGWGLLAAQSSQTYRFGLGMLSMVVLVTFSSTLLFRVAGSESSRMGHESALAISGLGLVAAMISLIGTTFSGRHADTISWLLTVAMLGLVLRDVIDTAMEMRLTASQVLPRASTTSDIPGPDAATTDDGG